MGVHAGLLLDPTSVSHHLIYADALDDAGADLQAAVHREIAAPSGDTYAAVKTAFSRHPNPTAAAHEISNVAHELTTAVVGYSAPEHEESGVALWHAEHADAAGNDLREAYQHHGGARRYHENVARRFEYKAHNGPDTLGKKPIPAMLARAHRLAETFHTLAPKSPRT